MMFNGDQRQLLIKLIGRTSFELFHRMLTYDELTLLEYFKQYTENVTIHYTHLDRNALNIIREKYIIYTKTISVGTSNHGMS